MLYSPTSCLWLKAGLRDPEMANAAAILGTMPFFPNPIPITRNPISYLPHPRHSWESAVQFTTQRAPKWKGETTTKTLYRLLHLQPDNHIPPLKAIHRALARWCNRLSPITLQVHPPRTAREPHTIVLHPFSPPIQAQPPRLPAPPLCGLNPQAHGRRPPGPGSQDSHRREGREAPPRPLIGHGPEQRRAIRPSEALLQGKLPPPGTLPPPFNYPPTPPHPNSNTFLLSVEAVVNNWRQLPPSLPDHIRWPTIQLIFHALATSRRTRFFTGSVLPCPVCGGPSGTTHLFDNCPPFLAC